MGSTEEDLATLWSRMVGSGKVDQGADTALQLDTALLQLHSQLSCGSQSGQPEGGNNVLQSNLSNASSLSDLNPPRRTASLPVPGATNYFSSNQGSSPNALQALQLSQYYNRMGSSSPMSSASHQPSVAPSGIPPLAPASKGPAHSLAPHLSALQLNNPTNQAQKIQQAQQALANSLKRNTLGLGMGPTEDEQQATNSYLQLARLLRHHSAPSSVLGAAWQNSANGNQSLLGANDGFLNAMFSDHLTTMSGLTSDSDGTQADSGTISTSFDLSRLQDDGARSALIQRSNSILQDQYGINDVMHLGNLELSSPANSRMLTRQDGSLGSADFHLGPYSSRDEDNRKRASFDILSERDQFMRKRCKSPDQDYESPRRRIEDGNDHHDQVQSPHNLSSFPSHTQNHQSSHHTDDLLPENSVLCKARAKRGCATHPRSIAERVRRTRISENMKKLQELVPNIDKQANTADMLEEAVEYMKYLKHQVQILSEQRTDQSGEDEKMVNGAASQSSPAVSEQLVNTAGS